VDPYNVIGGILIGLGAIALAWHTWWSRTAARRLGPRDVTLIAALLVVGLWGGPAFAVHRPSIPTYVVYHGKDLGMPMVDPSVDDCVPPGPWLKDLNPVGRLKVVWNGHWRAWLGEIVPGKGGVAVLAETTFRQSPDETTIELRKPNGCLIGVESGG